MTDWKAMGVALDVGPEKDLERLVPRLEELERTFAKLREAIPHSALPWSEPE